jgi:hypothetical protein
LPSRLQRRSARPAGRGRRPESRAVVGAGIPIQAEPASTAPPGSALAERERAGPRGPGSAFDGCHPRRCPFHENHEVGFMTAPLAGPGFDRQTSVMR